MLKINLNISNQLNVLKKLIMVAVNPKTGMILFLSTKHSQKHLIWLSQNTVVPLSKQDQGWFRHGSAAPCGDGEWNWLFCALLTKCVPRGRGHLSLCTEAIHLGLKFAFLIHLLKVYQAVFLKYPPEEALLLIHKGHCGSEWPWEHS